MRAKPGFPARASSLILAVVALSLTGTGCSLIASSTRPTPGADRNLYCLLEYRPDPARATGPDILFAAAGNPFKTEQVYMSLPDGLVHGIFAPGRHLIAPVQMSGVRCESPWQKGYRLPSWLALRKSLLCRRIEGERVEISVATKWGSCREVIPAGDLEPRCRIWLGRQHAVLERLSQDACPYLPEPTADSRRGSIEGATWIQTLEGQGEAARPGQWLELHQTTVDRYSYIVDSTYYGDGPRTVRLGSAELSGVLNRAIEGMKVGERRRVYPISPLDDELFFYELELVAIGKGDV